jgi:2,4-dienoyl-CoA reductase-like NADH-dependent reductase (Old Yellow Enzyme family)
LGAGDGALASEEGFINDDVLAWYQRFSEGRPGVIVVEATGVRDVPSGLLLRISGERFIPGLKQFVETVRRASDGQTRLFIQLIDFSVDPPSASAPQVLPTFLNDHVGA